MIFNDRKEAGQKLAKALKEYQKRKDVIILGLARGGVVVAAEIGKLLELPFDLIITRKIGAPMNPELAIGAITETGKGYFNEQLIHYLQIPKHYIEEHVFEEKERAQKRLVLYRQNQTAPNLHQKTVIVVDDGIATGATMMAAILSIQDKNPKEIIIAVPVAPVETLDFLEPQVDKIVCLATPYDFIGISQFYISFPQVEDAEIIQLLQERKNYGTL